MIGVRLVPMSPITLARELCESGYSYAEQARMTRPAQLHRLRRGAYSDLEPGLDPRVAHLQLLEATVRQSSPEAVVSHMSAAALHGLPVFDDALDCVHLTRDRSYGGKARRYVRLPPTPLAEGEVVEIAGFPVTSLARTVVDLSRSLGLKRAVAVGDAALARGLPPAELDEVLARAARRTGVGAARRAVAFMDGRSESVGESFSRVMLHEQGIPPTDLQLDVCEGNGWLVGRGDFGWQDRRTLGEFDGKIKYGRALRPEQSLEEVLFDEKRREDALRSLGWEIVRWIWADIWHPAALLGRLHSAFERGRRRR